MTGRSNITGEKELIDILRIVYKWKYLLLAGTAFCLLGAGVYSLISPKTYSVDVLIEPRMKEIDERGRTVTFDSTENMEALIHLGLKNGALQNYRNFHNDSRPISVRIKTARPQKTNLLKVSVETPFSDMGVKVASLLVEKLKDRYAGSVRSFQSEYEAQLQSKKAELAALEAEEVFLGKKIEILEKNIMELRSKAKKIDNGGIDPSGQMGKLRGETNENSAAFLLIHDQIALQRQELLHRYEDRIFDHLSKNEEAKYNLRRVEEAKASTKEQIRRLTEEKNSIAAFDILKGPVVLQKSVKSRILLTTVLTGLLTSFLLLLLVFFLEYVKSHKK